MKGPEQLAFTQLVAGIRRLHQRVQVIDANLHEAAELTVAQRGVLESLNRWGNKSVSQLALLKGVSRQYVQGIVNQLLDKEVVVTVDNPAHRRSPLICMTSAGLELFRQMRQREKAFLAALELPVDVRQIEQAHLCLQSIDLVLTNVGEPHEGYNGGGEG